MDSESPSAIFGTTIECECGRKHRIDPERVVYGPGAPAELIHSITAAAAGVRRIAVLMDVRTEAAAGAAAVAALRAAGFLVEDITVPDPPGAKPGASPACDDQTHAPLAARCRSAGAIVAAGSGVINDLGKWISFDLGIPYVSVATAASMNGYTSANVGATIRGVKTLQRARPPRAVVADPEVIRSAPRELTAAGLGDALAKPVSSADWRLNHLLFGDYFCPRAVALIEKIEPFYVNRPAALGRGDPAAVEALFHALCLTGAAMTMAESSAPASGAEHLVSHTLDMMAALDGRPHELHGRQVGVGTILASEVYRRVLAIESPRIRLPADLPARRFWGPLADQIEEVAARKRARLGAAAEALRGKGAWDRLREDLRPTLRPPEAVRACLEAAGAAATAGGIGCSRERLLAAFRHAHEFRERFTILDLARLCGVLPQAAEEIVEAWA